MRERVLVYRNDPERRVSRTVFLEDLLDSCMFIVIHHQRHHGIALSEKRLSCSPVAEMRAYDYRSPVPVQSFEQRLVAFELIMEPVRQAGRYCDPVNDGFPERKIIPVDEQCRFQRSVT